MCYKKFMQHTRTWIQISEQEADVFSHFHYSVWSLCMSGPDSHMICNWLWLLQCRLWFPPSFYFGHTYLATTCPSTLKEELPGKDEVIQEKRELRCNSSCLYVLWPFWGDFTPPPFALKLPFDPWSCLPPFLASGRLVCDDVQSGVVGVCSFEKRSVCQKS